MVTPLWTGPHGAAQRTPSATPAATAAIDVLFAQSFESGSFTPAPGAAGTYTLALHGVPQDMVWFASRPQRAAGVVPMAKFVTGRAFSPTNPPNAAIVAKTSLSQDTLVVELRDPRYDAATHTVTSEAPVIENYQREELVFLAKQQNSHKIDAQLKVGSLFVAQLNCSPEPIARTAAIAARASAVRTSRSARPAPARAEGGRQRKASRTVGSQPGGQPRLPERGPHRAAQPLRQRIEVFRRRRPPELLCPAEALDEFTDDGVKRQTGLG